MIRRFSIVFVAIALLIAPFCAYADVIAWEDWHGADEEEGNSFEYVNEIQWMRVQEFVANGPDGYVITKADPGSDVGVQAYRNSELMLLVNMYFHEEKYWGSWMIHGYASHGWVPMDQVLAVYSQFDFVEDYTAELYTYKGNYEAVLSAEKLVVWQWPGSDREKIIDDNPSGYVKAHSWHDNNTYKDKDGREWGYVYMSGWFCMDDPENKTDIPAFNPAPAPVEWSPDIPTDWSSSDAVIYPPSDPPELPKPVLSEIPENNSPGLPENDPPESPEIDLPESPETDTQDSMQDMPIFMIPLAVLLVAAVVVVIVSRKRNKTGGESDD